MDSRAPRVGHKKSRKGCAQCKRRHVKCDEESPCSNCIRHGVACSLAGGPNVPRDDSKQPRRTSTTSSSSISRTASMETSSSVTASAPTSAEPAPTAARSPFTILTGLIDRPVPGEDGGWMLDLQLMHHYLTHTKYILTEHQDMGMLFDFIKSARSMPIHDAGSFSGSKKMTAWPPIQMLRATSKYGDVASETVCVKEEAADQKRHGPFAAICYLTILQIWQEEMPRVAFTADYCMHALLGFSALHKAHREPELAPALRTSAVDHLDRALVGYREHAGPTTAENADAKFAFTWLVVLFAYAIPPSVPPIDAITELFLLVKGIDTVLAESWFWVSQGPFAPILTRGFQEAITLPPEGYTPPDGMDFGLNHLDYMLGVDAILLDDRRVCALILAELKQIYDSVLRQQGQASVASILCFPKMDSAPFSQLIKRRVPQALVVLAYYCVLLDVLDSRWWIHGWAARVLRDIMGTLPEQWQTWIQWPVQSVLLKPQAQEASGATEQLGLMV